MNIKIIITAVIIAALVACSPESMVSEAMTPDECKIERAQRVVTLSIGAPGDTVPAATTYLVTMQDGREFEISEAEALDAWADPVAACREFGGRE